MQSCLAWLTNFKGLAKELAAVGSHFTRCYADSTKVRCAILTEEMQARKYFDRGGGWKKVYPDCETLTAMQPRRHSLTTRGENDAAMREEDSNTAKDEERRREEEEKKKNKVCLTQVKQSWLEVGWRAPRGLPDSRPTWTWTQPTKTKWGLAGVHKARTKGWAFQPRSILDGKMNWTSPSPVQRPFCS